MLSNNKLLTRRNRKNNKLVYYIVSLIRYIVPKFVARLRVSLILARFKRMSREKQAYIYGRVNYYNKLSLPETSTVYSLGENKNLYRLSKIKIGAIFNERKTNSVYIFDTYEYTRFFDQGYKAGFVFGDVTRIPQIPSFVKSRPIEGDNANSVILPLNKIRHHLRVKDQKNFTQKKNMLIGRTFVAQPHRKRFWEMYFGHPMCDLGNTNSKLTDNPEWLVKKMSLDEQLEYKFILCLEGNDVATNLKWVMSSNSLAVMPKPKYETWYMEGNLIPNYHYVEIKSDYSDLEDRLMHYINNPKEAQIIIDNAHKYVDQFRTKRIERLIGIMVLRKYFICTGQIKRKSGKKSSIF